MIIALGAELLALGRLGPEALSCGGELKPKHEAVGAELLGNVHHN